MKNPFRGTWQRALLRPLIYMATNRFLAALALLLLYNRFLASPLALPGSAAVLLALAFALVAWLVYLRMDGAHIPRMKNVRFRRRKDPLRNYTDISDHIDDAPPTADDLEDDERDLISLLSNLFCLAIFAVLSFFL